MGLFRSGTAGAGGEKIEKSASGSTGNGGMLSVSASESMGQEAFRNTPWVNTKKRHFDFYESLASSVAQWRAAAFMMTVFLALSVAGNIYLAQSVKVQPYIVQVDRHGYALPVKMADIAGVDQRVIASQVGLFVYNSRMRLMDRNAQLVFTGDSYRSIAAGSPASRHLNDYYNSAPPTQARYPVDVEVLAVIPFTAQTYQAMWRETIEDPAGARQTAYVGLFTVAVSTPNTWDNLITNPLGVYITDYNIRQDSILN